MTQPSARTRPTALAVWLIIAGAIGWWAAFSLTMERLHLLADPDAILGCDISPLVQCGKNLESWQGSVFGFPNPILGLTGWMAPIVVGVAILAGARFARWFWWLFELGRDVRVRLRHLAHQPEHLRARHALPVVHGDVGGHDPDVLRRDPARAAHRHPAGPAGDPQRARTR